MRYWDNRPHSNKLIRYCRCRKGELGRRSWRLVLGRPLLDLPHRYEAADHSLVAEKVRVGILTQQEADASELQSVLTRAVGTSSSVQVDVDEQMLLAGDSLLLCSDGLTRMVTDPEIASTLLTSTSAQEAADRLVDLANENGGLDNVSAIVIRVERKPEGVLDRLKIWKRNSG